MKVTVVAEQLRRRVPGGIGTYARGLLRGLEEVAPGLDVEVLRSPVPTQVLTRAWDRNMFGVPRSRRGGVVHATSLAFPPPRGHAALTVMVHDLAWRHVPDAFPARGRRWHEAALRRAVEQAARIVVPSAAVRQQVAAMVPVVVIEEGCDHLPPPDHRSATGVLARAGLRSAADAPFLLTVGTLEPRKNLRTLTEAHRRSGLDVPLVVAGPRGWGDAVEPDAHDGRVHFAGAVDDATLAALYARATAFAYVPLMEGFGLPPVEAMHAGVPVVASDAVPSVADAALLVDPADVDAIAAALERVTTDDGLRARLRQAGLRRAAQLTWAEAAKRHVALWEEVAAE
jgi:glycosyltransferase involved in cell wall biosynthesis